MNGFSFTFTSAFFASFLFGLAGVLLWWLIRKRQRRVWLPTTKILNLPKRRLPTLTYVMPPLVPFFCFVLATLAVLIFSMSPNQKVYTPYDQGQIRYHVFVDLSPSVSAQTDLAELARTVRALWQQINTSGSVVLSSSGGPKAVDVGSAEELEQFLETLSFHRAGLRLGTAMREQLGDGNDVDRLIIISDGELYTWSDFYWQYFSDKLEVFHLDVAGKASRSLDNHYIAQVKVSSDSSQQQNFFEVEIARTLADHESHGQVVIEYEGDRLSTESWRMPIGSSRLQTSLRVAKQFSAADMLPHDDGVKIKLQVDRQERLDLDHLFRVAPPGRAEGGFLIAEPAGEMVLEDSVFHLVQSLGVLGIELERVDRVRQPGPDVSDYPFWLITGGNGSGVDAFCPKSLEDQRIAGRAGGELSAMPKVWLMPSAVESNYRELCWCFTRLAVSREPSVQEPAYCREVESRSQWVTLLQSLGARQLGGQIGESIGALAWTYHDAATGLEVVAFSVPLTPLRQTGLSYAQLPLLVKDLATWQGLVGTNVEARGGRGWPRVPDIVNYWASLASPDTQHRLAVSNVPLGESALSFLDESQLPPAWRLPVDVADTMAVAHREDRDPLALLQFLLIMVIVALVAECLWNSMLVVGRGRSRWRTMAVLMAALYGAFAHPSAYAQVELSLVDYGLQNAGVSRLGLEVASRTSIELEPEAKFHSGLSAQALGQPWLWVRNLSRITGADGRLHADIINWLRRGGFLVIEDVRDQEVLQKLTQTLVNRDEETGTDGWRPIPPDHEIMRSFYLLEALPPCNNDSWYEFGFDHRMAILVIPYRFVEALLDQSRSPSCRSEWSREQSVRTFVNILMVALATDYKKDQIHLPEILKRLR